VVAVGGGVSARGLIESADEVYVSAASIVECELKIEAGLLEADPQELYKGIAGSGFKELPVRARPAAAAASLKRTAGADGFDRLLVSQAMAEPLRFLTANETLKHYSELVELAGSAD
jgi:PIN domain nuclease of toxin-antitoxin system